jgi:hypothetical protein
MLAAYLLSHLRCGESVGGFTTFGEAPPVFELKTTRLRVKMEPSGGTGRERLAS